MVSLLHPKKLSKLVESSRKISIFDYNGLKVFHSFLFDPAWLCHDAAGGRVNNESVCEFEEFTEARFMSESEFKPQRFFPGAFTYHLHLSDFSRFTLRGLNIFKDVYAVSNFSYFKYFENYYRSALNFKLTKIKP